MKTQGYDAGIHVGVSQTDPETIRIRFFEQPGIQMTTGAREGGREALQPPRAPARAVRRHRQRHLPGPGARGVRAGSALDARQRTRSSGAPSASSSTTATRRRRSCCRWCSGRSGSRRSRRTGSRPSRSSTAFSLRESIGQAKRLVGAIGADLGAVFDRAGDRLFLVDEQGREIPVEQTLLLFLRLIGEAGWQGKVAFPVTVTSRVEEIAGEYGLEVVRTPAAPAELAQAATAGGRRLRGRRRRRVHLPAVPARLRRGREPLQAARAARARPAAAVRARRRAAAVARRPPRSSPARGRSRASSCACSPSSSRAASST